MTTTHLICTVGGSHAPIMTASVTLQPDFICFVCSTRDPATGKAGSTPQVLGKGLIIKANPNDEKATLPNIPSQLRLAESQYEVLEVPADDLDSAYAKIQAHIRDMRAAAPDTPLIADYTGGTKTMTAALVMAALEIDGVELQLVTGARSNLQRVHTGTEASAPANTERIRLERQLTVWNNAWQHYGYGEAANGLGAIVGLRDRKLRGKWQIARDISRAFDAWDRFDHQQALDMLNAYVSRLGQQLSQYYATLRALCGNDTRSEPLMLFDLWRNAERRAAQQRYDDAVARVYRLLEALAQWLLRRHCDIDTANVPPEKFPQGMELNRNRAGHYQAALLDAWTLAEKLHVSDPATQFMTQHRDAMIDHLNLRNHSILAHGHTPIRKADWQRLYTWTEDAVLPLLQTEAKAAGVKNVPAQLPSSLLALVPSEQ